MKEKTKRVKSAKREEKCSRKKGESIEASNINKSRNTEGPVTLMRVV